MGLGESRDAVEAMGWRALHRSKSAGEERHSWCLGGCVMVQ